MNLSVHPVFGGCEERVKELWHYNTTFGALWFNVVSAVAGIAQILTTCIISGYYHRRTSIEYLWWPIFECLRLFVLSMARVDVMLKDFSDLPQQQHSFAQTRRVIMLCNLVGAASLCIACPIYLIVLPRDDQTLWAVSLAVYLGFAAVRVLLTAPMFSALLGKTCWGLSDHRAVDGNNYARIGGGDDPRRSRYSMSRSGSHERNLSMQQRSSRGMVQEIPDDVLWSLAVEASQREADRALVRSQNKEYEEALRRQTEIEEEAAKKASMSEMSTGSLGEPTAMPIGSTLGAAITTHEKEEDELPSYEEVTTKGGEMEDETEEAFVPKLDPLPEEPKKNENTLIVRIRLPNGARLMRRFEHDKSIGDVNSWVNHELIKNELLNLVANFHLVTTMPRVVYDDISQTLNECGFWRANAVREMQTPMLYVEELMD